MEKGIKTPERLHHPSKLAGLCLPYSLIRSHSYLHTQVCVLIPFSFGLLFGTLNVHVLFSEEISPPIDPHPVPDSRDVTLSTWKLGFRTWDHRQVSQIASQEMGMVPVVKVLLGYWYRLLLLFIPTTPILCWEGPLMELELGRASSLGL